MVDKLSGGKAAPAPTAQPADLVAQMEAAKQKLKAIQTRISNTNDYSRYLSTEDQVKAATTNELAGAQIDMLDSYIDMLKNGTWDANAANKIDPAVVQDAAAKMATGWNDMRGATKLYDESNNTDPTIKANLAALGSQYAGTIMLENSGAYDPANSQLSNSLFFVAGDDVKSITGRTVGTDVQMQVVTNSGEIKTYVLKNMAVRPEPIYIYAGSKKTPINIDMSGVARIADGNWGQPFGTTNGFMIFGSQADDTIVGSSGSDVIVGGAGNDKLYGLGGVDEIYGDMFNADGASGFQTTDGNDIIDGGAGQDIIRAGGGSQDSVWNAGTDASVSEQENPGIGTHYNAEDAKKTLSPAYTSSIQPDGTLVIDHNPGYDNGQVRLDMPTGYNMASADMDSSDQSLVITMTKTNPDGGLPSTIHIRIKNFFDPQNKATLQFVGNTANNMIDFSAVTLGAQKIEIIGNSGNDVIVAPKAVLDAAGLSLGDLQKSTVSNDTLEDILKSYITGFDDPNANSETKLLRWGLDGTPGNPLQPSNESPTSYLRWEQDDSTASEFIGNGVVNLSLSGVDKFNDANANKDPKEKIRLDFPKPAGFDDAYLLPNGNVEGGYNLVFIKHTPDGIERAVVSLSNIPDDASIVVDGLPPKTIDGASVTITGKNQDITNDGNDTVFGSIAGMHQQNTGNAQFITGTYDAEVLELAFTNESDAAKLEELKKKRDAAEVEMSDADIAKDEMSVELAGILGGQVADALGDDYADWDAMLTDLQDDAVDHPTRTYEQWIAKLESKYSAWKNKLGDNFTGTIQDMADTLVAYANHHQEYLDRKKEFESLKQQVETLEAKFIDA